MSDPVTVPLPLADYVRFIGDNARLLISLVNPDTLAAFDPTNHVLLFTVKKRSSDLDSEALVQKISTVGGITIIAATQGQIAIDLVPTDDALLTAGAAFPYDVLAQNITTSQVYHVASGRLVKLRTITRNPTLSIPTYTTTPPISKYAVGTVLDAAPLDNGTWLQMNGQVVSQATYATLFKLLGHQPEFAVRVTDVLDSTTKQCQGIAFGNSIYVSVGTAGQIWTSPDLVAWTLRTSGVATALSAICWDSDNSLFVAVGASNVILTSPDGLTWTSRTSGVTSTLQNVWHANGRTVAVGTAGWITYSTNGTSWTAVVDAAAGNLTYLVYENSTWFSCATTITATTGKILYSTNGTTWNFVTNPAASVSAMAYAGSDSTYFYLVASQSGSQGNGVITAQQLARLGQV